MLGKDKCRILKEIRQKIADENEIPYVTRACHFQGECRGTCPRCESELRYLEQQLLKRSALGKRVAVTALCAGMAFSSVGCTPFSKSVPPRETDLAGAVAYTEPAETPEPEDVVLSGEVAWPEEESDDTEKEPSEGTDDCGTGAAAGTERELMGIAAYAEPKNGND